MCEIVKCEWSKCVFLAARELGDFFFYTLWVGVYTCWEINFGIKIDLCRWGSNCMLNGIGSTCTVYQGQPKPSLMNSEIVALWSFYLTRGHMFDVALSLQYISTISTSTASEFVALIFLLHYKNFPVEGWQLSWSNTITQF